MSGDDEKRHETFKMEKHGQYDMYVIKKMYNKKSENLCFRC